MKPPAVWIDKLPRFHLGVYLRPWLNKSIPFLNYIEDTLAQKIQQEAKQDFIPEALKQAGIKAIARLKERGVLVQLPESSLESTQEVLSKHVQSEVYLSRHRFQWIRNAAPRCFVVRGEPFIEDLTTKIATNKLKIMFQGGTTEPRMEKLYAALREYGKIVDLSYAKDGKSAQVHFTRVRDAVSARVCLHRINIDGASLFIEYEQYMQTNKIKRFIIDHPRVSLPVGAAIVLGISYQVFDPIRVYSINSHISKRFKLPLWISSRLHLDYQSWLPDTMRSRFGMPAHKEGMRLPLNDFAGRLHVKEKLDEWLKQPPTSVMLIVGQKGYGKRHLVSSSTKDCNLTLQISCEEITSRSESDIPHKLAKQVGYAPVFKSMVSLSNMVESLVTATTGQKVGISTSAEAEIKRVLDLTGVAISELVAQQTNKQKHLPQSQMHIEYPVVTISLSESSTSVMETSGPHQRFVDQMLKWATYLAKSNLAHVIVICESTSTMGHAANRGRVSQWLSDSDNQKSITTLIFEDASREDAVKFLLERLQSDQEKEVDEEAVKRAIDCLGGKLADIEQLLEKVRADVPINSALEQLIMKSVVEVRRDGLGESADADQQKDQTSSKPWTPSQFWHVLKSLALSKTGSVSYDSIKFSPFFGAKDSALQAMEKAEFIQISYVEGHPDSIAASKPLFGTVYKRIFQHKNSRAVFNTMAWKELIEAQKKNVQDLEKELNELSTSMDKASSMRDYPNNPNDVLSRRFKFITRAIHASQNKIEELSLNVAEASKEFA